MKRREIIRVKTKRGTGKELAKIFNVTTVYVSMCTNGKSNTKLARKIRKSAVEMGGDAIYESSND